MLNIHQKALKIALIGYGKMGKAIEAAALQAGHTIVLKITSQNTSSITSAHMQEADVAIEFTNPESAKANLLFCLDAGVPVVCGTTGWYHDLVDVKEYCIKKEGAMLTASNFSIGVNIFFEVNRKLAQLMSKQENYRSSILEIHHTEKKDTPSGTAITLANDILAHNNKLRSWISGNTGDSTVLPITSKRIDPAPGTHTVNYDSAIDSIQIIHTAHNREGFASGALAAAIFLVDKKGIFTMKDVLGL
jgi:4-hydroxy-tetrahydrodipicolinate reductase